MYRQSSNWKTKCNEWTWQTKLSPNSKPSGTPQRAEITDLTENVDVLILGAERGVAVSHPVDHGATGDDDGGKQSVDAVFESWRLWTRIAEFALT